MSDVKNIEYPFVSEKMRELKVGDMVKVSGRIFTGRDRLHKYLSEGGKLSVGLENGAIYHCGPIVVRKDGEWSVRAAGPTTSIREEPYMADIICKHGLRVIIGKGGMGADTAKACAKHGCVYLQATGGAGVLIARNIEKVVGVTMLKEFGPAEAVWELEVRDLSAVVAIDSKGRNLHKRVKAASKRMLKQLRC